MTKTENTRWVIAWRSRLTGYTGRGALDFRKDEVERMCAELNEKLPFMDHWPERVA